MKEAEITNELIDRLVGEKDASLPPDWEGIWAFTMLEHVAGVLGEVDFGTLKRVGDRIDFLCDQKFGGPL